MNPNGPGIVILVFCEVLSKIRMRSGWDTSILLFSVDFSDMCPLVHFPVRSCVHPYDQDKVYELDFEVGPWSQVFQSLLI